MFSNVLQGVSLTQIPFVLAAWEGNIRSWSFVDIAKLIIIVIAICAIVFVACRAMGIQVPQWLIQIGLIVVIAAAAIIGITLLASL